MSAGRRQSIHWRFIVRAAALLSLASLTLAGCAQTNALFDGTTGALDAAVTSGANAGSPPLPARRKPKADTADESGGGILAALPDIDLSGQVVAPRSVTTDDTPVDVYVRVARQIRQCWLGGNDPKLLGHGFRAEAKPGASGAAEIDVYKKVEGRKLGPFAFEVKITPEGSGSLVRSTNRRLEDKLANTLRADIARWTRGSSGCTSSSAKNA